MPTLPGLGTGLAPLAQWVVVPMLAFGTMCFPLWSKIGQRKADPGLDLPTVGITTSRVAADHSARPSGRAS